MWSCKKCGKPVYFAERRQSLGFDWHRECLQCEECGKVLHPGQHAEHKEQPYCYIPCYSALFGPKLFGHGSTVESHQSFGKRAGKKLLSDREFEKKVKEYNEYGQKVNGSSKLELTSRLVNGRLVLEGVLRIYWGVQRSIRVKEFEDKRLIAKRPLSSAVLDSEKSEDFVLRRRSQIVNGATKRESNPFYRHSVAQMSTQRPEDIWRTNNLPTWRSEHAVSSQEIVQRTLLHRTLSDSNLLCDANNKTRNPALTNAKSSSYLTLPANFGRSKSAIVPLRLDRYEGLSDLSKECSTLKFDLSSLQPDILDYSSLQPDILELSSTDNNTTDCDASIEPGGDHDVAEVKIRKSSGPRALRRRHGRKFEKSSQIRRRSSFNGHWYDRDTSVFTPPKDSCMSVWITSLVQTREVIQMILDKYKVETESERFALFVVKETGERRLVSDTEYPLVLRVNLGPHEEVSRLYIFDKNQTMEVSHEVAQYLRFSYAECRAILNMFYEEEEREVDYIRRKYKLMRKMISNLLISKWSPLPLN